MSLIELNGVTRRYVKGDHAVTPLSEADLSVERGSFFVLLGPSGSGKTTLLNLIAGIDRPDEGRIRVAGQDLSLLKGSKLAEWRAATVGYIFQQHHLIPVLTAYENVELPLHLFKMSSKQRHERVALALAAVGLLDRADHLPRQLSGGQEQRVAIARSIVADPPILVADEPTGDLDRESAGGILTLLQRLVAEFGKTVVMVTHDLEAAARGTRVVRLNKGKLLEDQP
ncbi:MAG TPA: ABC transporter ATP-binding protein [Planctomycetota bacterium]|mgnify:CR=1 FL=1|jgi:putative ABC transport system ATP-binding protein|nr:ABC transporter ATP-binding protein [Planctomycetota bacterium]